MKHKNDSLTAENQRMALELEFTNKRLSYWESMKDVRTGQMDIKGLFEASIAKPIERGKGKEKENSLRFAVSSTRAEKIGVVEGNESLVSLIHESYGREVALKNNAVNLKFQPGYNRMELEVMCSYREMVRNSTTWGRLMCLGSSQDIIDFLRRMLPKDWIPGHNKISDSHVNFRNKVFLIIIAKKKKK